MGTTVIFNFHSNFSDKDKGIDNTSALNLLEYPIFNHIFKFPNVFPEIPFLYDEPKCYFTLYKVIDKIQIL